MSQILADPIENHRSQFKLAHQGVATATQQAAHPTGVVAVVNDQRAVGGIAEQASVALTAAHGLDLLGSQPVLAHEPGAQILGLRCLGVLAAPLAKALVPAFLIALGVLASGLIGAVLAVRAAVFARLGEPIKGQRPLALGAQFRLIHGISLTCPHGMVRKARQPCHADVLLEIANGGEQ